MTQVTDSGAIEAAVDAIIAANPQKVEQAKAKPTMLGWFVGQVMKQTGGRANPAERQRDPERQARYLAAEARARIMFDGESMGVRTRFRASRSGFSCLCT